MLPAHFTTIGRKRPDKLIASGVLTGANEQVDENGYPLTAQLFDAYFDRDISYKKEDPNTGERTLTVVLKRDFRYPVEYVTFAGFDQKGRRKRPLFHVKLAGDDRITVAGENIREVQERTYGEEADDGLFDDPYAPRYWNAKDRVSGGGGIQRSPIPKHLLHDYTAFLEHYSKLYGQDTDPFEPHYDPHATRKLNSKIMQRRDELTETGSNARIKLELRAYPKRAREKVLKYFEKRRRELTADTRTEARRAYDQFAGHGGFHWIHPTTGRVRAVPFWQRRTLLPRNYYRHAGFMMGFKYPHQLNPRPDFIPNEIYDEMTQREQKELKFLRGDGTLKVVRSRHNKTVKPAAKPKPVKLSVTDAPWCRTV
jgi:hypothetical protein